MVSGKIPTEAVQNCEYITFVFGDGHHDSLDYFKWSSTSPTMTNEPIWVLAIVSLSFCTDVTGIDVNLDVAVIGFPPVTGKMFVSSLVKKIKM